MTDLHLPAQSFEEAIPSLRAPYMPSQVQAKIITVPENPDLPCTIGLYAIGETQMDRFTLTCGSAWDHDFTKLTEQKVGGTWYCMVAATFTVFGVSAQRHRRGLGADPRGRRDERPGTGEQARRPEVRPWPVPVRLRPDRHVPRRRAARAAHIPTAMTPNRHLEPYFDRDGKGQAYCRVQYDRWLTDTGIAIYGPPLDHLAIAEAIRSRGPALVLAGTSDTDASPAASSPATQNPNGTARVSNRTADVRPQANAPQPQATASPAAKQHRATPDRPANAVVQSTQQDATEQPDTEAQDLATARAYVQIHRAMDAHAYDDQAATRLAALAVGAGPRGHVDWAKVPADVLETIAELLQAAGSLGWSTEALNREVIRAHESNSAGDTRGTVRRVREPPDERSGDPRRAGGMSLPSRLRRGKRAPPSTERCVVFPASQLARTSLNPGTQPARSRTAAELAGSRTHQPSRPRAIHWAGRTSARPVLEPIKEKEPWPQRTSTAS